MDATHPGEALPGCYKADQILATEACTDEFVTTQPPNIPKLEAVIRSRFTGRSFDSQFTTLRNYAG